MMGPALSVPAFDRRTIGMSFDNIQSYHFSSVMHNQCVADTGTKIR